MASTTNAVRRHELRRTTATQTSHLYGKRFNSQQANEIRAKIMKAYSKKPFRGPPFSLPSGEIVVEDLWKESLNSKIDEILDKRFDNLKIFADENDERGWVLSWLKHKVQNEGSDQQKEIYNELLERKTSSTNKKKPIRRKTYPASVALSHPNVPMFLVDVDTDEMELPNGEWVPYDLQRLLIAHGLDPENYSHV
tara:strand:+ start:164 stop:748 length:585 start_codon:yes stop_codon:yes gene_type:complete